MCCATCKNEYHTTDEHEIFKDLFELSREDLVSQIISLEIENNNLQAKIDDLEDNEEK